MSLKSGPTKPGRLRSGDLAVELRAWGPDRAALERISRLVAKQPAVQKYLKGAQHRMISFEPVFPESFRSAKYKSRPAPPKEFLATFYDYTHNRTIIVTGPLDSPDRSQISESSIQPLPSPEEFEAALEIVEGDSELGPAIRGSALQPYRPMPPLVETELPDGRIERTIAIGLLPLNKEAIHEIVGVNMIRRAVIRYEHLAPPLALATGQVCNPPPSAGQPTAARGTSGQVRVTVRQAGRVVWRFYAVRPTVSSGTNGSGIELRHVYYRGKKVLYRAHAPILNVKYDDNACGPYRDWQWQEGMIQADGTDVAGFRVCPTPAKTILDTGSDTGNFLGTAIYVQGQEVVLVNEMQAGWYRYISEWRLHTDGTIRPQFGFDGVQNSCTCKRHHHHVYWRFDFDIRTAGDNVVREHNDPPIVGSSNWHRKHYEIRRPRNDSRKRRWRISNRSSGEGFTLAPGPNDGIATTSSDWPFPRGDVWILRYHGNELDDGVVAIGPPYEAGLDGFLNGEYINGRDVVVWYAGHFTHDDESGEEVSHIVGPELRPHNW